MRIETLATCHNRREKTLQALVDLHAQQLPDGVEMGHTIVDDGSSDGTSEAVKKTFPDVEIVHGDGGLFWAGGMRYGWNESVKDKSFDYLLVYNDDVCLHADTVARLLKTGRTYLDNGGKKAHAVVGAFKDGDGKTSYGGVVRHSLWHPLRFRQVDPPEVGYMFVDTMNMNACIVSKAAVEDVGFLSDFFKHSGADYEYGLKLRKSGGVVLLISGYVGECNRNDEKGSSSESGVSLLERWRRLVSTKEQPPKQRAKYYKEHGGPFWLLYFLLPYITLIFKHVFYKSNQ